MYQIRTVDGCKLINGYEIIAIGKGSNGLSEVRDGNGNAKFRGPYQECEKWLRDRSMLVRDAN